MAVYGFSSRSTAEKLKRIAGEPATVDSPPQRGRRPPSPVPDRLYLFTLTSGWTAGTPWPTATVTVASLEEDEELETDATLSDVLTCHDDMVSGDRGVCVRRGSQYFTIDTPC